MPAANDSPSPLPFDQQLLDLGYRLGRVEVLGTDIGAIHDGMAAIQFEWIFEGIQALAGSFIPTIDNPAVGLQQRRRPQITVAVPPLARASRGTAGTEDTFVMAFQAVALLPALQALPVGGRRGLGLDPGAQGSILSEKMRLIRH